MTDDLNPSCLNTRATRAAVNSTQNVSQNMCPIIRKTHLAACLTSCCLLVLLTTSYRLHADESQGNSTPENTATFKTTIAPFLNQHCYRCHGSKTQNGERRFDTLADNITDDNVLIDYQDILDQLNLGEMPPADEAQPGNESRQQVVDWLTGRIAEFHETRANHGGETILRRLNAREYRNTIRDLLNLPTTMFDPAEGFPQDQAVEHLDNVGDALITSGYLLERQLAAADRIVQKAIYPLTQPPIQTWTFRDHFNQQPEIDQVHRRTNLFNHMTLYDVVGADKPEGAYGPIHAFKEGVPFDGIYEIRLKAEALNRVHPYDDDFIGTDKSEPLRLGIVPGDHTVGPLHLSQPIEPLLAEIDLTDEPQWYTVRIWLDAGYTPRFTFRNGLMNARNLWGKLVKKYADQFPKPVSPGIVEQRFNAIKYGKLPQIHIHEIEIKGPFYDQWPTTAHKAVFGDAAESILSAQEISAELTRRELTKFASKAYRRPATTEEIDHVCSVVNRQQNKQRSSIQAYADGLKTVLCSPAFLYLEEPSKSRHVSATTLATRLSYFLWSSMPDEELLTLATNSSDSPNANAENVTDLRNHEVLQAQVERMLADKKSDAFIDGFLDSWLTLREFGSQPPDRDKFTNYYRFQLGTAMLNETRHFTRHLLTENLSIDNFLDTDFTFVNKHLAQHYGIDYPAGRGFQKVAINDKRRGGLLGQASILTVTANGIDTSPVVRGVWLLDNILGTPPSPPPPDVEPLDPDVRGAKTIRQQLEKHRTIASCNNCHRKIDPMGFALENFDPVGQWRTNYTKNLSIDASGQLPNGTTYDNIVSFKQILLQQKELFARALTSKLMAYATGRQMTPADRPAVDKIIHDLESRGGGMRDLILLIVDSQTFRGSAQFTEN